MQSFFEAHNAKRMGKILMLLGMFSVLFVGMLFVNQMKKFDEVGDIAKAATIDVSGTGEAFAVADVANISFTVEQHAASVHDAQTVVAKKADDAISYLKSAGIAAKDIKTTNYSAQPEYNYSDKPTTPKIIGYIVSETVTVKVRDTSKAGTLVDSLGSRGATSISGPDFSVDDPDAVNAQARQNAINDANEKARVLAKQLGVTLVRVVRFNESTGGYYPMYAKDMMVGTAASSAPHLEVGQNKYTSNVTITYEIQ